MEKIELTKKFSIYGFKKFWNKYFRKFKTGCYDVVNKELDLKFEYDKLDCYDEFIKFDNNNEKGYFECRNKVE